MATLSRPNLFRPNLFRPSLSRPIPPRRTRAYCLAALLFSLVFTLLLPSVAAAKERLRSTVDRATVARNESFELTVEWRGQARSSPDFSALEHQFEILGTRHSSQASMLGHDVDAVTRWHLTLMPKETGSLIIPSFRLEQSISEALTIEVTEPTDIALNGRRFWLESQLDRDEAYPGEQILLTYRLYYATRLRQVTRDELDIPGADVVPLRERQFRTVIDGTVFEVAELRFAIFATEPGNLEIPPLQLVGYSGEGADPRFGSLIRGLGDPVQLEGQQHNVRIHPRPEQVPARGWLPARGVSLSERWSHGDGPLRVGEPVTRTVRIDAQGVKAQQLPELDFGSAEGYRIYPESPRLQQREDGNGLLASRTESHALIASRPGTLTLPPITVQWWDSEAGQLRETTLQSSTLEVLPAEQPAGAPADPGAEPSGAPPVGGGPSEPGVSGRLLPWLALSALLNLVLAGLLLHRRHRRRRPSDEQLSQPHQPTRRQLNRLAASGHLRSFRSALLTWGQYNWPDESLLTLKDLGRLAGSDALAQLLQALDEALYGREVETDTELCHRIMAELPQPPHRRRRGQVASDRALPPLYPGP